jgi:ferrous iron transport protein B
MEHTSILATIASPFAIILIPLGFGAWQLAAAAITGFIAKENVVGTLAVCYGITNFINTEELALVGGASEVASIMGLSSVAALAYLMFNLFTPPCFAAIGAIRREMGSRKWTVGTIAYMCGFAYAISMIVYQLGGLMSGEAVFSAWTVAAVVVLAVLLYLLLRKGYGAKKV